ncbi:MAG: hypothetical protein LBO06_05850 [Bacteroidales bacterium]|jgi:hypothetical protein|nr:hypothetical protein [Bacteroidales bacterium]
MNKTTQNTLSKTAANVVYFAVPVGSGGGGNSLQNNAIASIHERFTWLIFAPSFVQKSQSNNLLIYSTEKTISATDDKTSAVAKMFSATGKIVSAMEKIISAMAENIFAVDYKTSAIAKNISATGKIISAMENKFSAMAEMIFAAENKPYSKEFNYHLIKNI